jgi:hypothetical protein
MGYSADKIQGGIITIPKANTDKFVQLIQPKEERIGHISWCKTVEEYNTDFNGNTVKMTTELLTDFGFVVSEDKKHIVLESWGGDKIGSSWDDVWEVLAQVVDPTQDFQWILVGEDSETWGERLHDGKNTKHKVATVLLDTI